MAISWWLEKLRGVDKSIGGHLYVDRGKWRFLEWVNM